MGSDKRAADVPKYRVILNELRAGIQEGKFRVGERLPSETDLGANYGVSRLTVQRALKELQIEGLVDRRAGSGTYVNPRRQSHGHLFGLLIPGLGETEIFEPICQGMAEVGGSGGHALLWEYMAHGADGGASQARRLCADFIERRLSGVFYAPIEGIPDKEAVNVGICETLTAAKIPVVLLDRCIYSYPKRSQFDLVGIDNRRAGYRVTQYLIDRGCSRPAFLGKANSAPTVDARAGGFRDAAAANGCSPERVVRCDPTNVEALSQAIRELEPDGFACSNDVTAAQLLQTLEILGIHVPDEMRIVGIDDVRYASHLRVPLTTLRQPCRAMGEAAVQTMLTRIANPDLPARDVLLECTLVVRHSCGE